MPFTSELLAAELIPYWSKVVEDVTPTEFEIEDLEFISVFQKGDRRLKGSEIRELARAAGAIFGLVDGKRILQNAEKLSPEVKERSILLFGTMIQTRTGRRKVPFLWFIEGKWEFEWVWIDHSWAGYSCVVPRLRPRHPASSPADTST